MALTASSSGTEVRPGKVFNQHMLTLTLTLTPNDHMVRARISYLQVEACEARCKGMSALSLVLVYEE